MHATQMEACVHQCMADSTYLCSGSQRLLLIPMKCVQLACGP
jgi:hypothetical protein